MIGALWRILVYVGFAHMSAPFRNCLAWFAAILLMACASWAQQAAGKLQLTVLDPAGSPVHATGRLQRVPSGRDLPFKTDSRGNFAFPDLSPGLYRLRISAPG